MRATACHRVPQCTTVPGVSLWNKAGHGMKSSGQGKTPHASGYSVSSAWLPLVLYDLLEYLKYNSIHEIKLKLVRLSTLKLKLGPKTETAQHYPLYHVKPVPSPEYTGRRQDTPHLGKNSRATVTQIESQLILITPQRMLRKTTSG